MFLCFSIADWENVKPPPLAMTCFHLVTLLLLLFYCDYFMSLSYEKIIWRFCWFLAPVRHLLPAFDRVEFVLWLQNMNTGSWRDIIITPTFPASFWDASLNPKLNLGWRFFFSTQIFAGQCLWVCWKTWAFGCSCQGCPPCWQKHECLSRGAGVSASPWGFGSLCLQDLF